MGGVDVMGGNLPGSAPGHNGAPPERRHGWVGRIGAVVAMLVLYYGIQYLTRVLEVYPHLGLPDDLVQRGGWVQAFDHHWWQLVIALACIGVLARGRPRTWGLNLNDLNESFRITKAFVRIYGLYFLGVLFALQLFVLPATAPDHPWALAHAVGHLAFGFLFVGVSEEILFRGLIHTYLARAWTGVVSVRGVEMPVAGIIAAGIFTLAHIGFSLTPLEITHLRPLQLVQAAVLGLFYSWAYHRTGSLVAPVLAHNFSDGALWLVEYVAYGLRAGPPW